MNIQIEPGSLAGVVPAIFSKSDIHRCIIASALSSQSSSIVLQDTLPQDIGATIDCLRALGAKIHKSSQNKYKISPCQQTESAVLPCRESGSTLRFLLPVAAVLSENTQFTGTGRLAQRPLKPLLDEMGAHGCRFSNFSLPFTVWGKLTPGQFLLPGDESSQYITGLLFALPLLPGDSEIWLTSPLQSRGYVQMTICTLQKFGITVTFRDSTLQIPGNQVYQPPESVTVEGDWSNAAFWLAAGAMRNPVSVTGLNAASLQGDREILSILSQFGAKTQAAGDTFTVFPSPLQGIKIHAENIPDLVPVLSVAACAAQGDTILSGIRRLRFKESDRIFTTKTLLQSLGGRCTETDDALIIHGTGTLKGGCVNSFSDHRIAMAACIAACICTEPVLLHRAEAVDKSYPAFYDHFKLLGGKFHVL